MGWDAAYALPLQNLDDREQIALAGTKAAKLLPGVEASTEWRDLAGQGERPFLYFKVPRACLVPEDVLDLGDEPHERDADTFFVELQIDEHVIHRTEVGRWALRLRSNRSSNRPAWNTACLLMDGVAKQLGGVFDERGPNDLTTLPLSDLVRNVRGEGEPSPAWLKAHAPDGDVEAAIVRVWGAATTEELAEVVWAFDRETQLMAAVEACRLRFAKSAKREPSLEAALRALEWFVEGKSLLPAVERSTAALAWQYERMHESWPAGRVHAAEIVLSVVDAVVAPGRVPPVLGLSSVWAGAKPEVEPQLNQLMKRRFRAPALALLQRLFGPRGAAR